MTPGWWECEPMLHDHHMKILRVVPIPTEREIVAYHPGVFLQYKGSRWLHLIEMVGAWVSDLTERRAEKLSKYLNLYAKLR